MFILVLLTFCVENLRHHTDDMWTVSRDLFPWRHNERHGVSNHQPLDCLFYALFKLTSKKTSKVRVTGPLWGKIHRWPVNFPHKGPVTRKMFPFDDVIMFSGSPLDPPACAPPTLRVGVRCGPSQEFYAHGHGGRNVVIFMMTSSNGNIFSITGPLCREFTGDRWIPLTKASHRCFLSSVPE